MSPGGQLLETIELGAQDAGLHGFQWDASKFEGPGSPTFKVESSLKGVNVPTTSLALDTVMAVSTTGGNLSLELAGRKAIAYSDIRSIL
jgi:flagellar basal-body rod modification protein FlgD